MSLLARDDKHPVGFIVCDDAWIVQVGTHPAWRGRGLGAALVAEALRWVAARVPYRWGGCSPAGVDCSCFVREVYATVGIRVPRTTVQQRAFDRPIGRDQLAVGDTLFFDDTCDHATCGPNPTHEGLYLGGGLMAEAGDPVQVARLDSPYWRAHYAGAGRPPGI
jgi:cell wall-associated NlpC family hydrolase